MYEMCIFIDNTITVIFFVLCQGQIELPCKKTNVYQSFIMKIKYLDYLVVGSLRVTYLSFR